MLASVSGYGGTMRKSAVMALVALVASPVFGSTDKGARAWAAGNPVDMLYPEIAVDDEGWRGLLPVILLKTEDVADQPAPAAEPAKQSERGERRGS